MKKTIYLYKSGVLVQRDYSLVLHTRNNESIYIPIQQIDQIICFGEVTFNKRTLVLLNRNRVTIMFFDFYGNYIGRYCPKEYSDGKILMEQVKAYNDLGQRAYISRKIIQASVHNEMSLLKYYSKKGRNLDSQIEGLQRCLDKIVDKKDIASLLLIEAQAKQFYYQSFDVILNGSVYIFEKRSKNPPTNEINAMLSYGYSLLYAHYLSVLCRSSLNPQISFIHSLNKSYDSLKYDLADITKSVIVDRMVIRMVRKKQVNPLMFDKKENGRCYLNKNGVIYFVKEFDNQLNKTIQINKKVYSYKSLISREVHLLSNYLKKNLRIIIRI